MPRLRLLGHHRHQGRRLQLAHPISKPRYLNTTSLASASEMVYDVP
jgi:hypothetical protein